jgi:hypothetical protein
VQKLTSAEADECRSCELPEVTRVKPEVGFVRFIFPNRRDLCRHASLRCADIICELTVDQALRRSGKTSQRIAQFWATLFTMWPTSRLHCQLTLGVIFYVELIEKDSKACSGFSIITLTLYFFVFVFIFFLLLCLSYFSSLYLTFLYLCSHLRTQSTFAFFCLHFTSILRFK